MEICSAQMCTGCAACMNVCPRNAISMKPNDKGFIYPVVNNELCITCNICKNKCPQNLEVQIKIEPNYYAALNKNDRIREESSSGGIFDLIAKYIISKNGIVCGAAFDSNFDVKHLCVDNIADLKQLRGSKYVQSYIGTIYSEVEKHLENGRYVLFTGTPCQVAGLRTYLSKSYEKLFALDLVCHGVPSPAVYRKWINYEKNINGDISRVGFRYKDPGWRDFCARIDFQNGKSVKCALSEGYMRGFLKDLYLRDSCYECKFANMERFGDITLGDYWGYKESAPEYIQNDDRGISLVIVNTDKGRALWKTIRSKVAFAPRTFEDAVKGNPVLIRPNKKTSESSLFWDDFHNMTWEQLCEKYYPLIGEYEDKMSKDDRTYFSQPYVKHHRRHKIHCWKIILIERFKRIIKR